MNRILDISELPIGPLERYLRDIYIMSKSELTFDDFKIEWHAKNDQEVAYRNLHHPIVFDRTVKLDEYRSVRLFKRQGEEWMCSECDMAPNGGCGNISLSQAMSLCNDSKLNQEILSV